VALSCSGLPSGSVTCTGSSSTAPRSTVWFTIEGTAGARLLLATRTVMVFVAPSGVPVPLPSSVAVKVI
jgi:hypothetical protein